MSQAPLSPITQLTRSMDASVAANRSILMIAVSAILAAGLAGFVIVVDMPALPKYIISLSIYGVLTAVFVASRIQKGYVPIFEFPVFISLLAFIQWGLAPLGNFFLHDTDLPPFVTQERLVEALPLCVGGMVAFWAGAAILRRRIYKEPRFVTDRADTGDGPRLLTWAAFLFVIGAVAQLALNTGRLTASADTNQLMAIVTQFGNMALVIVCIELYSRADRGWFRLFFWAMLPLLSVIGFFSGMKGLVLVNILVIAMVRALCRRKVPMSWIVGVLVGIVAIYPLMDAFRSNSSKYGQATSVDSAANVADQAYRTASEDSGEGWLATGYKRSVQRLDMLANVAQIQALGPVASAFLDSGERFWMIPFYPFVPRLIWKEKPNLDQGRRLSILTGGNDKTALAVTYVGDAYRIGGILGVIGWMFAWGMSAEWVVQFLYRDFGKKRLFVYICLAGFGLPIEGLVFTTFTNLIREFVIASVLALLIYGAQKKKRQAGAPNVQRAFVPMVNRAAR